MNSSNRKRELVRAFKERTVRPGIYAFRCVPSGQVWVDGGRDVDRQENGIRFQLRLGSHMNKPLQAAWNAHGETAFAFEVLDVVEEENALLVPALLKERTALWREQLGAAKLTG